MTNLDYAPTLSELRGVKDNRNIRKNRVPMFTKFKKNDIVTFAFNGLKKTGRVTTVLYTGLTVLYNIATESGQWYQRIPENTVLGKQEQPQPEPIFEHRFRYSHRNLKFV